MQVMVLPLARNATSAGPERLLPGKQLNHRIWAQPFQDVPGRKRKPFPIVKNTYSSVAYHYNEDLLTSQVLFRRQKKDNGRSRPAAQEKPLKASLFKTACSCIAGPP